jgi:2Fe-2S ferredoxin
MACSGRRASISSACDAARFVIVVTSKTTVTVHLFDAAGQRHSVTATAGRSLMRAAVDGGLDGIAADCGGSMSCATCHVFVAEAWRDKLAPLQPDENDMLEMTAAERRPESRLSCQIALTPELDGLEVTMPSTQY